MDARRRADRRARRAGRRVLQTAGRAARGFIDDQATQSAAAISYYALFSVFPLAIVAVVGLSWVVDDEAARSRVIDVVLDNVPLREERGRRELEDVLRDVTQQTRGFGIAGGLALLFAASGVMGAVRTALNRAWNVEAGRPLLQAKLLDVLLVLAVGLLIGASFALTLAARLAGSLTTELTRAAGEIVPAAVAFTAFAVLFRVVPATTTRLRDVWPGAVVAALGFELAKAGFAFYLANFANYAAVYASLAAAIAFVVFVFVTANVFLFGAEVAVQWPAVRDGEDTQRPSAPLGERLRGALAGLFVRSRASRQRRDEAAAPTRSPHHYTVRDGERRVSSRCLLTRAETRAAKASDLRARARA